MQSRQIGFWQTTQLAAAGADGCLAHVSNAGVDSATNAVGWVAVEMGGSSKIGTGADCDTETTPRSASCCAMIWLAVSVASRPQPGQAIGEGIRPLIGSI